MPYKALPYAFVQTRCDADASYSLHLNTENFMNSKTNTINELEANLEHPPLFLLDLVLVGSCRFVRGFELVQGQRSKYLPTT